MLTITQHSFGGPEALQVESARPEPAPGEVLVRVEAIGLNPVDAAVRAGHFPLLGEPPFTLGWDVAGIVEQLGAGVNRFGVGDRVFGMPRFPAAAGTYAEFVAAPADELARIPGRGLDAVRAAALPLVGLTAWQGLVGSAGVEAGQHVLVTAAGGGVGHIAVQVAKARGARVTGTASAGKHAFVKELGADAVVDYRGDLTAQVHQVDVAFDLVGGTTAETLLPLLRPGGVLVTAVRHSDEALRAAVEGAGHRFVGVRVTPDAAALEALAGLAADGRLRVHVERTFPLDRIADAHRLLDTSPGRATGRGITGKLVAIP